VSFPGSYREIRELVREKALETPMARAIVRKSGFIRGLGTSPGGRPPTTILRTVKFTHHTFQLPFTGLDAYQFSRVLRRRYQKNITSRTTTPLSEGIDGAVAQVATRFWLEGYTEVRIVARVFADTLNGRLLCGFALPAYNFIGTARLPDTAALIGGGSPNPSPPTSPIVVPMSAPYAISPWVPIHEMFLGQEIQCAFYIRSIATSGVIQTDLGACDIQVR
jgi:hypothetical protein